MDMVKDIDVVVRQNIATLLDVKDNLCANDARRFAEEVGMGPSEINVLWSGTGDSKAQPTNMILKWWLPKNPTVEQLVEILQKMQRHDVLEVIYTQYHNLKPGSTSTALNASTSNQNDATDGGSTFAPINATSGSSQSSVTDGGGEINRIVGTKCPKEIIRTTSSQEGQAAVASKAPEKTDTTYYSVSLPIHDELSKARSSENDEKVEKIQKDFPDKCDEVSGNDGCPPAVFISYQWDIQRDVLVLKGELEANNIACWMDIGQIDGGDELTTEIAEGIEGCKIFLSCITDAYTKSKLCGKEVALAYGRGKPNVPVLFEPIPKWPPSGSMAIPFTNLKYVDCVNRAHADRFKEVIKSVTSKIDTNKT